MAIPAKRYQHPSICYLDLAETKALLKAPNRSRWLGRRDHALLLTLYPDRSYASQSSPTFVSTTSSSAPRLTSTSPARDEKRRTVTLTRETQTVLRQWLIERQGQPRGPAVVPTQPGRPLSRDAVELLLAKHAGAASTSARH